MMLVDIHAHLDHARFMPDLDKVIENARKAGVKAIITSGVNSSTNKLALEIAEKYPDIVKPSFGLYPIDALAKEIEAKGLLGTTYLDLGLFYKARKRTDQARECISKAIQVFEECKAEVYLAQANEAFESLPYDQG